MTEPEAQAARVAHSWFVGHADCDERVLLATSQRANYEWVCSCGKHGTIASSNLAFAQATCRSHLTGTHSPAALRLAALIAELDAGYDRHDAMDGSDADGEWELLERLRELDGEVEAADRTLAAYEQRERLR